MLAKIIIISIYNGTLNKEYLDKLNQNDKKYFKSAYAINNSLRGNWDLNIARLGVEGGTGTGNEVTTIGCFGR